MDKLLQNPSKLDKTSRIPTISIIQKRQEKQNRIIEIELNDSDILKYATDVYTYCEFTVNESGYYNINNQCCIQPIDNNHIDIMQFGICDIEMAEFGKCINSKALKLDILVDELLSENLTTFKFLKQDKKYMAWINIVSEDNDKIKYIKEYSHLFLIKL